MFAKLSIAVNKFFFCLRVAGNPPALFRLLKNTKRLAWSKKQPQLTLPHRDPAIAYRLRLKGVTSTVYLRTYAGDLDIFFEVFWRSVYASLPPNAGIVVDLGAHVGLSALFFLRCSPQAQLYLAEPDPANYDLLQKNLAAYIQAGRVTALQGAIATQPVMMLQTTRFGYNSSTHTTGPGIRVKGFMLSQLLEQYSIDTIDLLKADIEGAEAILFEEAGNWLPKVKTILIELHSGELVSRFEQLMQQYHFSCRQLLTDHGCVYLATAAR